jgi:hypothetical protein
VTANLPRAQIAFTASVPGSTVYTANWTGQVSTNTAILTVSGGHLQFVQAGTYLVSVLASSNAALANAACGVWLTPGGGSYYTGGTSTQNAVGGAGPAFWSGPATWVPVPALMTFDAVLWIGQAGGAGVNVEVQVVKIG